MSLKWTFLQATIRRKYTPTSTSSSWNREDYQASNPFHDCKVVSSGLQDDNVKLKWIKMLSTTKCIKRRNDVNNKKSVDQDEECEARRGEVRYVDEANEALHNLNYNLQERHRRAREERQEEAHVEERHELRCVANAPRIPRPTYHWQAGRESTFSTPSATSTSQ